MSRSLIDPGRKKFARHILMNANPVPIDSQGRIIVPQLLRQAAHLERDVTLGGVGLTVEIWNPQRLETMMSQTKENFPSISSELAEKLEI